MTCRFLVHGTLKQKKNKILIDIKQIITDSTNIPINALLIEGATIKRRNLNPSVLKSKKEIKRGEK